MDTSSETDTSTNIIDEINAQLSQFNPYQSLSFTTHYVHENNQNLIDLLRKQSSISLITEMVSLLAYKNSSYKIAQDGLSLHLSPEKWSNIVLGPFKIDVIEKSLKYSTTTLFFLYSRLWPFTPFYYQVVYPTIDIFDHSHLLRPRSLSFDELALFSIWGTNKTPLTIVDNFQQFVRNFNERYEYNIWKDDIDWNLFVIAGGSVVLSLLDNSFVQKHSDVDLFFLNECSQLFRTAVNELETKLQNKYFVKRKTLWPNRLVQFELFRKFTINDIFRLKHYAPSVVIQLIRPGDTLRTISQIIYSFDFDACAAAFNSKQVIISFGCLQALNSSHTTCYAIPLSSAQYMRKVSRLFKYQQRGFNILTPKQFDINKFLNTRVEDCKEKRQERTYRFRRQHFGDNSDSFLIQKQFCSYYNLN